MSGLPPLKAIESLDVLLVNRKIPYGHTIFVKEVGNNRWEVKTTPREHKDNKVYELFRLVSDDIGRRDLNRLMAVTRELKIIHEEAIQNLPSPLFSPRRIRQDSPRSNENSPRSNKSSPRTPILSPRKNSSPRSNDSSPRARVFSPRNLSSPRSNESSPRSPILSTTGGQSTLRGSRGVLSRLSLPSILGEEVWKLWLGIVYDTGDMVVRDPDLYNYSYHQREELAPLFLDGATPINCSPKDQLKRYYHANTIVLEYDGKPICHTIAAAAPYRISGKYYTLDTRGEFWEMILKTGSKAIFEIGESEEDVFPFIPSKDEDQTVHYDLYHPIKHFTTVEVTVTERWLEKSVQMLKVTSKYSSPTHHAKRITGQIISTFHCKEWSEMETLDFLVRRAHLSSAEKQPVCVTSRLGGGTAGTFIVALALKRLHLDKVLTVDNHLDIIRDLVIQGKRIRGPIFVEKISQLELLIQYANFLLSNSIY